VTTHLLDGEPVDVITRLVETLGIDLLILGHKRSKKFALRWWRGSVDTLLIERVALQQSCSRASRSPADAAGAAGPRAAAL
jgi:hypothetical protein